MKKLFLILALLTVAGFTSQANAGVVVSLGGGGYCARGYPAYYGAPGYYYYDGPSAYYGPRYYYGHRHYHYRNGVRVYFRF